jgi:hypothetical protein
MTQSKPRQYIDFKLHLTQLPDGKGACQVVLLPTPEVGESVAPVTMSAEKGPPANPVMGASSRSVCKGQERLLKRFATVSSKR